MANELYASVADINTHLPIDKAQITDGDDDLLQVDTYRFIRARLAGSFAATVFATWVDPDTTPEVIRSIAGRLIASKWYATLYAEDSMDDAVFAQRLYNEAMGMIDGIITGQVTVVDPGGTTLTTGGILSEDSFWPNDDSPKFTMDQEFA